MEASTREVQVFIAHERDRYYKELLESVTRSTTPAVNPPPCSATHYYQLYLQHQLVHQHH
eukprot:2823471-Amphidinium_carterae.3